MKLDYIPFDDSFPIFNMEGIPIPPALITGVPFLIILNDHRICILDSGEDFVDAGHPTCGLKRIGVLETLYFDQPELYWGHLAESTSLSDMEEEWVAMTIAMYPMLPPVNIRADWFQWASQELMNSFSPQKLIQPVTLSQIRKDLGWHLRGFDEIPEGAAPSNLDDLKRTAQRILDNMAQYGLAHPMTVMLLGVYANMLDQAAKDSPAVNIIPE